MCQIIGTITTETQPVITLTAVRQRTSEVQTLNPGLYEDMKLVALACITSSRGPSSGLFSYRSMGMLLGVMCSSWHWYPPSNNRRRSHQACVSALIDSQQR